jgi:hypothetical protein
MDILARVAHAYWDWIASFSPVLCMLIIRWACLLILLLLFGVAVRFLSTNWFADTLAVQISAATIAIIIGLAISLDNAVQLGQTSRNMLLSLAMILWIILPYFVPRVLIRKRGRQELAWRALYIAEAVLLAIQLLVLYWSTPC